MVPHAVVTVSLATALLPRMSRLASDGDLPTLARTLGLGLRTALAVAIPFALLLPIIADDLAHVTFGWGAGRDDYVLFAPSLALFGTGLVFFTIHYITLRGFYALERNRTVFFIQCAVAATNIVAAIVLVRLASAPDTSAALVLAYTASYVVGSAVSYVVLGRLLGGLETGRLLSFLGRLALAALPASAVALGLGWWCGFDQDTPIWAAALQLFAVTAVDVGLFLLLAHLLRLEEVTAVLRTVTGRLAPRRGGTTSA
jgi:putative peptidoglycan lipid II flippase